MNNIFDSHSHYNDARFDEDRDALLASMPENGVCGIIHASTDIESTRFGLAQSEKYPFFYAGAGLHPEEAAKAPADYLRQLEELARSSPKIVAIGEIGLDYYYEGFDRDLQLRIFEEQLQLAKRLDLPVILHSREATRDCMDMLKKYRPRGVMHCFSGSAETAREVQALGLYISFTGVLTFKNARKAAEALMAVADDRLLLETDCPYMAPEPYRGKRCDSTMIPYVAQKIAELKGGTAQEVLDRCTENTCRLFGIQLK